MVHVPAVVERKANVVATRSSMLASRPQEILCLACGAPLASNYGSVAPHLRTVRYALTSYCDDGQIEIGNSAAERAMRGMTMRP